MNAAIDELYANFGVVIDQVPNAAIAEGFGVPLPTVMAMLAKNFEIMADRRSEVGDDEAFTAWGVGFAQACNDLIGLLNVMLAAPVSPATHAVIRMLHGQIGAAVMIRMKAALAQVAEIRLGAEVDGQ